MSDSGIIWKNLVFYIIIAVILLLALLYFLWKDGPIRVAIDGLIANVSLPKMPEFSLNGVGTFLQNNATLIGIAAPLGITAVTYFVKNYQTNKLLDKKIEELSEVKLSAAQESNAKIAALQKEVDAYKSDTTAETLQKRLSGLSGSNEQLQTRIIGLESQITQLSEQPKQIIQQLWQASGSKVQTIAGEQVKVIELEPRVLVK